MMKKVRKTACLVGIAALFSSGALAADYGGACCQDLEERIAELEATAARKDNRKVSLTVYGQVNYAILHTEIDTPFDGVGISETTITNNPNSQTRFGFKGDAKISPDWSAGFLIELGIGAAEPAIGIDVAPFDVSLGSGGKINSDLVVRHSALYLQHAQLGTVWLGQTSTATDGIAEISVANTAVASTLLSFEPLSSAWLGGVNTPFDGGRTDVVRWISPTFAGFSVSAAWMGNAEDSWDVALRYAGELGDIKLAAGIGYRKADSDFDTGVETIAGSASVMHVPSGLFVSGAAGKVEGVATSGILLSVPVVDFSAPFWFVDPKAVHVQGGIERNFFGWGNTTLYGEWARLESSLCDCEDGDGDYRLDFWGLGVVQSIDNAATDLYVGYRNYDLDVEGVNASTVVGGAIIRF
jgi:hypothetical protein